MKSVPGKFLMLVLHSLYVNSLEFLSAFAKFREATICFVMSVLSSNRRKNSVPTGRNFMKFDTRVFENPSGKFKFG